MQWETLTQSRIDEKEEQLGQKQFLRENGWKHQTKDFRIPTYSLETRHKITMPLKATFIQHWIKYPSLQNKAIKINRSFRNKEEET